MMVASLQCKKEALEAKLRDKTNELKKLCFEEAELTGVLPAETPLEPGETPPHFPRRIGTSYSFPENLIDKLYSKEDRAIASLELECQIQTGIAEAALGIANDGSSSRSVRRRHKIIYQDSQRKLFDLESKLNALKNTQSRPLKKMNSSPSRTDGVSTGIEEDKTVTRNISPCKHETLSHSLSDSCVHPSRHYHSYNSLSRTSQYYPSPSVNHYKHEYYPGVHYANYNTSNYPHPYTPIPYQNHPDTNWYLDNDKNLHSTQFYNNETYYTNINRNRTAIVEKNDNFHNYNDRMVSTLPRNGGSGSASSVLLPGQTYPDNSLIRTQSLGNVANYSQLPGDKKKEKQWYETSLDSPPVQPRTHQLSGHSSPVSIKTPEPPHPEINDQKYPTSPVKTQVASVNNFQFEMVVPYESPKNHTVIEAGKWQPYREVTKPFEMSDFYKYSTKFRKGKVSPALSSSNRNDVGVQLKAVYQPLQPQECQPLSNELDRTTVSPTEIVKSLPTLQESSTWSDEKPGNSGTLV